MTNEVPRIDMLLITADRDCGECAAARAVLERLAAEFAERVTWREISRRAPEAQRFGVVLTPVVVVDGMIVSMGRRPPQRRLRALLEERCGGAAN